MTFEIIVGLFIITNTCLQMYWFFWSRHIHIENVSRGRKHFTDGGDAEEIETYDKMRDYWDNLQDDRIREDNWKEFTTTDGEPEEPRDYKPMTKTQTQKTRPIPSEVKPPQRYEDGRYKHSEIDGEFDGFFNIGAALFDAQESKKEIKETKENDEKK